MASAVCRCGQTLPAPAEGSERIVCPKCGARVRIRVKKRSTVYSDGFIRFPCPCGRRLKVSAEQPPKSGKCPDCGRVVPVPDTDATSQPLPPGHPESPTQELSTADAAALDEWSRKHLGISGSPENVSTTILHTVKPAGPVEVGLRVCPKCGRPVHLSALVCRECGALVPKR
jgi:DNA-directed RNA polymerase subunit M/transcription elongation factor TFIIS